VARERGAAALVIVDAPAAPAPAPADWKLPAEAPLVLPQPEGPGDAGLPVVMVKRRALEALLPTLMARGGRPAQAAVAVELVFKRTEAFNIVGRIPAGRREGNLHLVLGAHYDHLGFGGRHSLTPERHEPHLGADDNASGTAVALEIARALMARRAELRRDIVVALFSGEEAGLLGSAHYVRERADALKEAVAMINLDMVGRLRGNLVDVLGTDSATEWRTIVEAACREGRVECRAGGDGHGPSDQASFYGAGVPVLHFFTGAHADYHKPTDRADRVNAAGAAAVARVAENVLRTIDVGPRLAYQRGGASPTQSGDARSFNASLGTIPDYAGPPGGAPGVLLSGVRPGGAADRAGLRRGDVIVKLGRHEVRSVEDLMYALNAAKPGETVTAIVKRDGKPLSLEVTYQEAQRRR
jgi:hypothetical protein